MQLYPILIDLCMKTYASSRAKLTLSLHGRGYMVRSKKLGFSVDHHSTGLLKHGRAVASCLTNLVGARGTQAAKGTFADTADQGGTRRPRVRAWYSATALRPSYVCIEFIQPIP